MGHFDKNIRIMKTYCILPFLVALAFAKPRDLLHAECNVDWTVSIDCATAQTKIVQQINEWDNEDCETKPGDTEPHGQKCLYKHTWDATNPTQSFGTHTTPIARYVDDFDFTFEDQNDGSCSIKGHSISETLSLLDYGTNYCNVYNLMDGSGLTQDPGYSESTNDLGVRNILLPNVTFIRHTLLGNTLP